MNFDLERVKGGMSLDTGGLKECFLLYLLADKNVGLAWFKVNKITIKAIKKKYTLDIVDA